MGGQAGGERGEELDVQSGTGAQIVEFNKGTGGKSEERHTALTSDMSAAVYTVLAAKMTAVSSGTAADAVHLKALRL